MPELKGVGIDEKGYGKVYKVVMRNSGIPLVAKAIYAYFCSYAGSGTTAFPHREKIIHDLQITKNTFTKHINFIVEAQYIARYRTTLGNVYEILIVVPDKDGIPVEAKSLGYGTIPKLVMLDERLSASAKAIYAYLCSYAGGGHVAYPHRSTILRELRIGKDAYYPHYNMLINTGYVTPAQGVDENGHYSFCTYRLNEVLGIDPAIDPDEQPISAEQCDSQKPVHGNGEPAEESDSQIPGHGDEIVDSQKSAHGDSVVFNMVFNEDSQKPGPGDEATSQKPVSQESVYGNLGHPNTKNKLYNKQSSSNEEDNITNPRARTRTRGADTDSAGLSSRRKIKELIGYDFQVREIKAWARLKKKLGHFPCADSAATDAAMLAYADRCTAILDEIAHQLRLVFEGKGEVIKHRGKRYERAALRLKLETSFTDRAELTETIAEIADKGDDVKNLRAYVKQLILNRAKAEKP